MCTNVYVSSNEPSGFSHGSFPQDRGGEEDRGGEAQLIATADQDMADAESPIPEEGKGEEDAGGGGKVVQSEWKPCKVCKNPVKDKWPRCPGCKTTNRPALPSPLAPIDSAVTTTYADVVVRETAAGVEPRMSPLSQPPLEEKIARTIAEKAGFSLTCSKCKAPVKANWPRCPSCKTPVNQPQSTTDSVQHDKPKEGWVQAPEQTDAMGAPCAHCSAPMKASWARCPGCKTPVAGEETPLHLRPVHTIDCRRRPKKTKFQSLITGSELQAGRSRPVVRPLHSQDPSQLGEPRQKAPCLLRSKRSSRPRELLWASRASAGSAM